ncbi:bifunctional lysylphosphatidylglycerol flippase/synthetase MprF [Thermogemmatispora carboxidivorans]|uniref:bifunctional lysylphosphatidylglycerol flippase/synthetase MprF n=1 Tax=Thermogemmatispora carboxidivorans TaxID=1382306 RepID=UPI00069B22A3|nr:phosphatidylglycerol lysyltransferase domain-containing protein [Thermogemmatispora carboxidivorans]
MKQTFFSRFVALPPRPGRKSVVTPSRRLIRGLLALTVALLGCINGLVILLPFHPGRLELLRDLLTAIDLLAPFGPAFWPFVQTSHTIALLIGFFLILLALGLARGKERAWQVTMFLLPLSALLHVLRGLALEEALLSCGLWGVLLLARPCFQVASDPWRTRQGFALLAIGAALLLLYGIGGYYLIEGQFLATSGAGATLLALLRRMLNLPAQELLPLTRRARWFLDSLPILAVTALLTGMMALLRPVSARWWLAQQREHLAQVERRALDLLQRYGQETLAFFALDPANLRYLAPNGEGLVAYRLVNAVAVVPGDPICPPEAREQVSRAFLELCQRNGWQVAIYQVHPAFLPYYRAYGLSIFKIGEEALIDPRSFSLSGPAMANVRTSSRRAEREGVTLRWLEEAPPPELYEQMVQLSRAWLQQKGARETEEMGFSMGRLSELPAMAQRAHLIAAIAAESTHSQVSRQPVPRLTLGLAFDRANKLCAFVSFTPIYGLQDSRDGLRRDWGWALDVMRRAPDAPYGVMELLLVRAIERFREAGAWLMSLGLIAASDTNQELSAGQRAVANFLLEHVHILEEHRTLFRFKQKFQPRWESRYVAASNTLALPRIALAILNAHQQRPAAGEPVPGLPNPNLLTIYR